MTDLTFERTVGALPPGKEVPRWRPIQTLIALTDNPHDDLGGFECARGFHLDFADWASTRGPSLTPRGAIPAPCVGDFTPIRPEEDREVIERVAGVRYAAGDVVAFDWRIPHANASRHLGLEPRACVYGGFLPDVPVNRAFAERQWERYCLGYKPDDQWLGPETAEAREGEKRYEFSALGQRLMAAVPWDLPPLPREGGGVRSPQD